MSCPDYQRLLSLVREAASTLAAKLRRSCPGKRETRHSPGGNVGQDAVFSPEVWAVAWSLREAPARLPKGQGQLGAQPHCPEASVCGVTSLRALRRKPQAPCVSVMHCLQQGPVYLFAPGRRQTAGPPGARREVALALPGANCQVPREPCTPRPRFRPGPESALKVPPHSRSLPFLLNVFGDKETRRQTLVTVLTGQCMETFLSALGQRAEVGWGS